jgi:hypothetical protein
MAGVALLGASALAITPVGPPPPEAHAASSREVRLTAESSVLNIPINLIQDVVNIPYNFVQGVDLTGRSLLFSGAWLFSSSVNVWGTDPGDRAHYQGLAALFPFPAFSQALAEQITGTLAVLLPINSGCDSRGCPDLLSLTANWYSLERIAELLFTGQYHFDDTPVDGHPPEGLWNSGGPITWGGDLYGHPEWNTELDPDTNQHVVPWAGDTFKLDYLSPFTNYWITHLMSDPTSPENTIKFPTLEEIGTAIWHLAFGAFVAFSPFFPGSPWCLGLCGPTYGPDSALQPPWFYDPPPEPPLLSAAPLTSAAALDQDASGATAGPVDEPWALERASVPTLSETGQEGDDETGAEPSTPQSQPVSENNDGTEESTETTDEESDPTTGEAMTPEDDGTLPATKPEEQEATGPIVRDSLDFTPRDTATNGSSTTPSGGSVIDQAETAADDVGAGTATGTETSVGTGS